MDDNDILSKAEEILSKVKHPSFDVTLKNFGMLKEVSVSENKVTVTIAYPFEGVPIKDQIENSVKASLDKIAEEVLIKRTVMNQEELQNFLSLEQAAWGKG